MSELQSPGTFLAACAVHPAVFELRPDYRALLLIVDGIDPKVSSSSANELISASEAHARSLLAESAVEELPHIASWREAYRAFGAKPQRTRNSLEALTRRAEKGLPRVNALTDVYNAVSVLCQVPVGGEDFHRYDGPARLVRAVGDEDFGTVANGQTVIEQAEPGEVVWRDDVAVTCRRWNWRQCRRTGLSDDTRTAFFILDALAPVTDAELNATAQALTQALSALGSDIRVWQRQLDAP
jgi:DNA/RNA-binding domain of Phe-tRNA-synthetase-like protein